MLRLPENWLDPGCNQQRPTGPDCTGRHRAGWSRPRNPQVKLSTKDHSGTDLSLFMSLLDLRCMRRAPLYPQMAAQTMQAEKVAIRRAAAWAGRVPRRRTRPALHRSRPFPDFSWQGEKLFFSGLDGNDGLMRGHGDCLCSIAMSLALRAGIRAASDPRLQGLNRRKMHDVTGRGGKLTTERVTWEPDGGSATSVLPSMVAGPPHQTTSDGGWPS